MALVCLIVVPCQREAAKDSLALDGLTAFAHFSELGLVGQIDCLQLVMASEAATRMTRMPLSGLQTWEDVQYGMSPADEYRGAFALQRKEFNTTHWSVVLAARGESTNAQEALEKLCRVYWYPLYAFVRRQGHSPEDAEDLIQGFFARLLQRKDMETVQRERGRFRSYLLVSLKHFTLNEQLRARAEKRGGGHSLISLDEVEAEKKFAQEPVDKSTPEKIFERRWAMALLDKVLERLRQEYEATDRLRLFDTLRWFLSDEPAEQSQAEIGAQLGLSTGAVKQAVWRLRQRYRELLHEEVANTVATAADIDDEVRHLVAVLRGP